MNREQQIKKAGESDYHRPVLLNEVLEGLQIKPEGVYVDCTFGGGGHSIAILKKLGKNGKLIVFDQDEEAKQNVPKDDRVIFIASNFRHIQRFLRLHKIGKIDGLLADLGVSSHQFDEAERGFSIRYEADMDMRMDKRQSLTGFEVVNTYGEERLHKIFELYGEITNAKTLARTIVGVRNTISLKGIQNFKSALQGIVKGNPNRYFAQVFQAIRIEVNDEFGALKDLLVQVTDLLKPGGRIAIITFHSLEDRIIKKFFRKGSLEEDDHSNPFGIDTITPVLKNINKKPITPGSEELKQNPRSRSAKMRIAEKI
jgi:16S rRNA (cytosine1402-N4)-methyltransferase